MTPSTAQFGAHLRPNGLRRSSSRKATASKPTPGRSLEKRGRSHFRSNA